MHAIAISLVVSGCLFNCWAIVYLLRERRRQALQKKRFQRSLDEIEYHLHRARK
jgi:hypothetical protein